MLEIGPVYITPGALRVVGGIKEMIVPFLNRHRNGDWGDVPEEDKQANDYEVEAKAGGGMLSSYIIAGEKVWISTVGFGTTEVYTTILLPREW